MQRDVAASKTPLGVHWVQHPGLTWVVGGFSLVHSFFGSLDPFRCRTFNILLYLYYLVWSFSQSSSGVATSVVITRILLPIWIYWNVIHVEDMYGIYCSFSVYIRTWVVPCLGEKHFVISTNKNIDVVSCWHLVNIWCSYFSFWIFLNTLSHKNTLSHNNMFSLFFLWVCARVFCWYPKSHN